MCKKRSRKAKKCGVRWGALVVNHISKLNYMLLMGRSSTGEVQKFSKRSTAAIKKLGKKWPHLTGQQ